MKQQMVKQSIANTKRLLSTRFSPAIAATLLLLFAHGAAFSRPGGNASHRVVCALSKPVPTTKPTVQTKNTLTQEDMELQELMHKYKVKIIKEANENIDILEIDHRIYHNVDSMTLSNNLHNLDVLKKHGLKLLPFDEFRQRILSLFHVDMAKQYALDIDYSAGMELNYYINAFGFVDMGWDSSCELDDDGTGIDESLRLRYSNITKTILYNDTKAANWVLHNFPDNAQALVSEGGFMANAKLLQSAIDSTNWNNSHEVEEYLFRIDWVYPDHRIDFSDGTAYDPNSDEDQEPFPSYTYRPYVVDTLLHHHVNLALLTDFLEKVESGGDKERDIYPQPKEDIDQLYRSIAMAGFTGYLNDRFNDNPTLADHFAKKNYMDCPELKDFCEKFEDKHHQKEEEAYSHQQYIINDPDGYTNLRLQANVHSPVVMRIPTNSLIKIHYAAGNWLKVSYRGKDGFVYKTRIYQLLTQP